MSQGNLPGLRWKRWVGRAAAVAFGIVMAWLLLEVGLRVAFDALSPGVQGAIENVRVVPWDDERIIPLPPFNWDVDYQYVLRPGLDEYPVGRGAESFHVSSISLWGSRVGLRSLEPQWPVDIAVVGDSFSLCFVEWEDCWVEQLRQEYGLSVMNFGQSSTGTRAHRRLLVDLVKPLEPNIVIWQWYGNDFNDDFGYGLLRGEYEPLETTPQITADPDFGPLARYSAVYAVLRELLWNATHESQGTAEKLVSVFGTDMRVGDDYNLYAYDLSRPTNIAGYEQTVTTLDDVDRVIREEMGAEWVLVLMPTKEEVYAEQLTEALGADYLANLAEGRARMNALCAERGWRCLDMTDALREHAQAGEIVYYARDLHINPAGNAIVTAAVGEYLLAEGLIAAGD